MKINMKFERKIIVVLPDISKHQGHFIKEVRMCWVLISLKTERREKNLRWIQVDSFYICFAARFRIVIFARLIFVEAFFRNPHRLISTKFIFNPQKRAHKSLFSTVLVFN